MSYGVRSPLPVRPWYTMQSAVGQQPVLANAAPPYTV